jgi:DNA-binding PadR family transcriptional regulator
MVFLASSNPSWSGSAGAIYPLIHRLGARGLLRGEAHRQGRRRSRRYTITRAGLESLRRWLARPDDPLVVGMPPDPLRTRLPFLGALPPARRRTFLESTRRHIAESRAAYDESLAGGDLDPINELLHRGAAEAQETRLRWLDSVLAHAREKDTG